MKIAIDISQIVYEGSGVARYTRNLIEALLAFDKKNQYIFFLSSLRKNLDSAIRAKITPPHLLKRYPLPPTFLDFLWNRLHVFPIDNFVGKTHLVLTSDWSEPPSSSKKITVVHDLVFLKFPETLPQKIINVQKRRLGWVIKESRMIIADSQSTKDDLIQSFKIAKDRIEVVYPAVVAQTPSEKAIARTLKKYQLTNPFILTVSKLEPRKNLIRLIQAFLKADLKNLDLVIVGQKGWGDLKLESSKRIHLLGFVSDEELYSLYKSALFFVYPSLYEGFGLPVVEAMSLGCPVVTSNTSSPKEIAERSALLFNPYNKDDMTTSLIEMTGNENLRRELAEKGLRRSLDFSERTFAKNLLNVFEKAYGDRR